MDFSQFFDIVSLPNGLEDLYDLGVQDYYLPLIEASNTNIKMSVKTSHGISDVMSIPPVILQGDTMSSIIATGQIDNIAKEWHSDDNNNSFCYREQIKIGILGVVDDNILITKAGPDATLINAFMNVKAAETGLQFNNK